MMASWGMRARAAADGREDRRAQEGEHQADPVDATAVRIDAVQHGDGGAERGDLRQREVDEDHAALHHVDAEVGVNAGEDQAGDEGRQQRSSDMSHSQSLFRPSANSVDQQIDVVVEQLEVVGDFLDAAHRRHQHQPPCRPCPGRWRSAFRRSKYGSTRISLTLSRFIVLISSSVWLGDGGMPGFGST